MKDNLRRLLWEVCVNGIGKLNILPGRVRYFIYKIGGLNTESFKIRGAALLKGEIFT